MGTRSTVKFIEDNSNILSVYQQYDGYPSGVGQQIVNLIDKYTIVNGIAVGREERVIANGFSDLALFYVLENKKGAGNMYATTSNDSQEYDYEIHSTFKSKSVIERIIVHNYGEKIFDGTVEEFKNFVMEDN